MKGSAIILILTSIVAVGLAVAGSHQVSSPTVPSKVVLTGPPPNVQLELQLWDGSAFSNATASLWIPGSPPTLKATTSPGVNGNFTFNSQVLNLKTGDQFFVVASQIGYQNVTTQTASYDATQALIDLGKFTIHGSLAVDVSKAFSPAAGVPSPTAQVTDHGLDIANRVGLADGTVEFGIDWSIHPKVDVTISKTGWLSNATLQNVLLKAWSETSESVELQTTLRVNILSQLNVPVPEATATITSFGPPRPFVDGSGTDQDGRPDGIIYIALDPLANPTFSITVSQIGFSSWSSSGLILTTGRQLVLSTAPLLYNLRVNAMNELGGSLVLSGANTSFTGLAITQLDFSQGSAFIAAAPIKGNLTISQAGFVSAVTYLPVIPSSSSSFSNQTITYQPSGGSGPGLLFTVKVLSVSDELGNPLQIGSAVGFTSSVGTFVTSSGEAYLPAIGRVNITAVAAGFVSETVKVTPSSSSQTTILFNGATSGATLFKPGLQFRLKVIGIYDQLGNKFELNINATLTSPSPIVFATGLAYIAASSTTSLTVYSQGYATITVTVAPNPANQTTILFRNGGVGGDLDEPGLLFSLRVSVAQAWDGSTVAGASVQVFSDPLMRNLVVSSVADSSGTVYLAIAPGTFYLRVSAATYPTFTGFILVSSSGQAAGIVRFPYTTTVIAAGTSNILLNSSTDIPHAVYSTTFGITFSYSSTSVGMVNATIPQTLVPTSVGIDVVSGGQTISVQSSRDGLNTYLQVPTPPGKGIIQIIFRYPTASLPPTPVFLSPLFVGALAFVMVIIFGVVYTLLRRRNLGQLKLNPREGF